MPRPCAYCGQRPGTTKDHVIPECLFRIKDQQMITVKACAQCNGQKSLAVTSLRDYLVFDYRGSEHPEARRILVGPVVRSILKNHSVLARTAVHATELAVFTARGIEHLAIADVDDAMLKREIEFIVRGLSYHEHRTRLPPTHQFRIGRVPEGQEKNAAGIFTALRTRDPRPLGDNVFFYLSFPDSHQADTINWLLCFYDRVLFLARSEPAESSLALVASAASRPQAGPIT